MKLELLDARLKRAEAKAYQQGNKWLVELCRKKRAEAQDSRTERPERPAKTRSSI